MGARVGKFWTKTPILGGGDFAIVMDMFFISPPQQKKNTPKEGQLFSFFEIFTAEFTQFLVTKNIFFLAPKIAKK
jgi:hypothetical protein